jgi:hypothetical protein
MPKPGMTSLCLKQEVADLVRKRAAANNQGLNEYLSSLLLGPSIQPAPDSPWTVPTQEILHGSLVGHLLDVQRVVG